MLPVELYIIKIVQDIFVVSKVISLCQCTNMFKIRMQATYEGCGGKNVLQWYFELIQAVQAKDNSMAS